jgi:ABC-2 type transport system permease protein
VPPRRSTAKSWTRSPASAAKTIVFPSGVQSDPPCVIERNVATRSARVPSTLAIQISRVPGTGPSASTAISWPDAASTLQYLIPILIILLAFTKFAGEREDGTLRQLAAAGTSTGMLAAGKALGVAAALAFVLVPAAAIGAAALLSASGSAASGGLTMRIAALTAVYVTYFGVFVALALGVSAAARRSSHALALLIAFWVLNAIVVPRAASDVSRVLYETPTAFEFGQRVQRDIYDGLPVHAFNVRRAADLRERLLGEYKVSRIEELPVNFRGVDYLEREAHSNDVWESHYKTLWTAFEQQTAVHHRAGWVAPLMAVRALSMALAGADFFHHRDFAAAAETYRRRLVLAMNSQLAFGDGSRKMGAFAADASFWSTVAPFTYQQPGLRWALSHVGVSFAALGAWAVFSGALLVLAVRRMTVE